MSFAKSNDFHITLRVSRCKATALRKELTNYIEETLNPSENDLTYRIKTTGLGSSEPRVSQAHIHLMGEMTRREYCALLLWLVQSPVWHVMDLSAVSYWREETLSIQTSAARYDTCYDEMQVNYLSETTASGIRNMCDRYEDIDTRLAVAQAAWHIINNNETIQTMRIFAPEETT